LGGEPFFVVTQPVHAGLIAALREQVIPRLLAPAPPSDAAKLAADPLAVRCMIVLDREGFAPKWFADLKAGPIAILTYHKYPGENWPVAEFRPHTVRRPSGEVVERDDLTQKDCYRRRGLGLLDSPG
jgi:hypothetical protein